MAGYKRCCIHCGSLIGSDSRFCSVCGSDCPFGYLCPACLKPVEKTQTVCPGCGRPLHITCPFCGETTFVQSTCEKCGKSLTVVCENPRCGSKQFFENQKCTACGKKLRPLLQKR